MKRVTVLLAALLLGCPSASPDGDVDGDTGADDASVEVAAEAAVDALADSGCPAPATITPEMVPPGYLPVERVNLNYDVDGDTAHFFFTSGDHILRYLFVNTEESSGASTTDFGKQSKAVMAKWLADAKEIKVAVRQGKSAGTPDLDPYGRWLSLIFVDGELLQARMVREGLTAYYTLYGCAPAPVHQALVNAEAEAFANGRGIWAPGHPTDYKKVLEDWIGTNKCRPNPYEGPYCK